MNAEANLVMNAAATGSRSASTAWTSHPAQRTGAKASRTCSIVLRCAAGVLATLALAACGPSAEQRAAAVDAFAKVHEVFQHPRCANCHIPGDAPLQFDTGIAHAQGVQRGAEGKGAAGLPCSTCHGETNSPVSYGPHAPPGAPHWQLPPSDQKMAWIGLDAPALCAMLKDRSQNGDRDLDALDEHVSEDKLVLWGWEPGGDRAPVSVPHAEFVAAFRTWKAAGGPCSARG